jgi:hypothetical protein
VTGGASLGVLTLWCMEQEGDSRGDMGGRLTLGGVAGEGDGFVSTGTLGGSSGMTCVVGSVLYNAADC